MIEKRRVKNSLSVRLVAGDDEVHPSGHEPMAEDLADSPERESLRCVDTQFCTHNLILEVD